MSDSENHYSKAKLLIQQDVGHKSSSQLKNVFLYVLFFEVVLHFKDPYVNAFSFKFNPVCMHSSDDYIGFSLFTLHVFSGALFACVAFTENLSSNVSSAVFSRIYAATVAWCPGFIFLLSTGLCIIPITLLG